MDRHHPPPNPPDHAEIDEQEQEQEQDRQDDEQVEMLLGALPSLWHGAQTVIREMGWDPQPRQPQQQQEQQEQPHLDPKDQDQDQDLAAALAQREQQFAEQLARRRSYRSPTPATALDQDGNERICRLCFATEFELTDDGASLGRLISPCRCDGSMRYVHVTCLSEWRIKSKATEAARICGQCSTRYRLRPQKYASIAAFVQASQHLRMIAAFFAVAAVVILSGLVGTATLYTIAKLEGTSLSFVRDAALASVQMPKSPWNISLAQDEARADVLFFCSDDAMLGSHGSRREIMVRATLDVISRIRDEKSGDPVWYQNEQLGDASQQRDTELLDPTQPLSPPNLPRSVDQALEQELHQVQDLGGSVIIMRRRWSRPRSETRGSNKAKPNSQPGPESSSTSRRDKRPGKRRMEINLNSLASALGNKIYSIWSNITIDDNPFDPDDQTDETASSPADSETGTRLEYTIVYNFVGDSGLDRDVDEHVLVRPMPTWLGSLRYVPLAILWLIKYRILSVFRLSQHLFIVLSRCAVLLSILVCESWRELAWFSAKSLTAAAIAYLDEGCQAAVPLPPNAVLHGPPRARKRVVLGRVREALSFASTAVFGPFWLNWWGGYPLSVYLGPRSFSSSERVEIAQLAPVFGPTLTILVDFVFVGLARFSAVAGRIRETRTRWWRRADWVVHDASAAEGYRRLAGVWMGEGGGGEMGGYDAFLVREGARVLPGRVRPLDMARAGVGGAVLLAGCWIVVFVGLVVALDMAWSSTILVILRQAGRAVVHLASLVPVPDVRVWRRWSHPTSHRVRGRPPPPPGPGPGPGQRTLSALLAEACADLTQLYGCFHGILFVLRVILIYLPMIPFAGVYNLLEDQIKFDLAQQQVLDRDEPLI